MYRSAPLFHPSLCLADHGRSLPAAGGCPAAGALPQAPNPALPWVPLLYARHLPRQQLRPQRKAAASRRHANRRPCLALHWRRTLPRSPNPGPPCARPLPRQQPRPKWNASATGASRTHADGGPCVLLHWRYQLQRAGASRACASARHVLTGYTALSSAWLSTSPILALQVMVQQLLILLKGAAHAARLP